jgi:D-methionine transport system ATP-binding protein
MQVDMIKVVNVSKIYGNGQVALDNVNLVVEVGTVYGVIGSSGAGKSTLIRLLNGLEKPTSGDVWVGALNVAKGRADELRVARQRIGMVFQHFNLLWSRTVGENIAFYLEIAGVPRASIAPRVAELVKLVGLQGRINAYPSQLSGGQKQRVGIARALANHPDVLLCDEATSALDPKTTDSVLQLLKDINRRLKITIVLITHEMEVVRKICDRVAVMDGGKIVEEGEVLDVFSAPACDVTRQFLGIPLDTAISRTESAYADGSGIVARLTFVGEHAYEPVIAGMAQQFGLDVSILEGRVSATQGGVLGELRVRLPNDESSAEVQRYFEERNIGFEVLQHA